MNNKHNDPQKKRRVFAFFRFLAFFILIATPISYASTSFTDYSKEESTFCKEYGLGRYFYCEEDEFDEKESKKKIKKGEENGFIKGRKVAMEELNQEEREIRAMKEREEVQEKLERLQVLSVMYPTEENLMNYMVFQQEQVERASRYSEVWKKVLWKTPNLDYTLKSPVSSLGNQIAIDKKNQEREVILKTIFKRYGIFFFYSSKCIYCHKYIPILKSFILRYNINIIPITMDGIIIEEWPNSKLDQGKSKFFDSFNMKDKPVPATFLFDQLTKEITPVGYGLLTYDELSYRIFELVSGSFKKGEFLEEDESRKKELKEKKNKEKKSKEKRGGR